MTTISSTDKNITLESLFSLLAPHWLAGNLLLAMAYFLTGNLGLLLAIPPGFATAVWPASGIDLGWILLYGWRLLPGVVCGSFAVNLVVNRLHHFLQCIQLGICHISGVVFPFGIIFCFLYQMRWSINKAVF